MARFDAVDLLRNAPILPVLPFPRNGSCNGDYIPAHLDGATIVAVGTLKTEQSGVYGGGGLVIDYVPRNSTQTERLILSVTERAMWLSFDSFS